MKIWSIQQDLNDLYGVYLDRAVVVADTDEDALRVVRSRLNQYTGGRSIRMHRDRCIVTPVGLPEHEGERVLCVSIGEDNSGPQ